MHTKAWSKHSKFFGIVIIAAILCLLSFVAGEWNVRANSSVTLYADAYVKGFSYIVFESGSTYYAISGLTGERLTSGADLTVVAQSAIDNSGGGTVLIRAMSADCGQLVIPDSLKNTGLTIRGEGRMRPILTHSGTNEPFITVENPSNNYYYVTIENLDLRAGSNTGAYPIIDGTKLYRSLVFNCALFGNNKMGEGIQLGGYFNTVLSCYIESCLKGIDIESGANGNKAIDVLVRDCITGVEIDGDTFRAEFVDPQLCDTFAFNFEVGGVYASLFGCRIESDVETVTAYNFASGANGNRIFGGSIANVATKVSNLGVTNKFIQVYGYTTVNSVTFTSISNGTYVAHGLAGQPDYVAITLSVQGYAWYGATNSTHVEVCGSVETLSGTMYCEYEP